MTTDPATTIDAAMLSMHSDPARDNAHNAGSPEVAGSILTSLICDADGDAGDRVKIALGYPGQVRLREHFEVTPNGHLVSAYRSAL